MRQWSCCSYIIVVITLSFTKQVIIIIECFLIKLSLESTHNLIIPEAVEEQVQHGDYHHVEHRHYLVLVSGEAGLGHHINKCNGSIEQSDCSKVGGTCGEGLVAAFSGAHLQDGDEDIGVGNNYDKHC